jgi:hypothetical protein
MHTGSQKLGRRVIMLTYLRTAVYFKNVFGKYTLKGRLTKFFGCRTLFVFRELDGSSQLCSEY